MKGIFFSEFLEMAEDRFSEEVAEQIIEAANFPSGGSYTSLSTYDHGEILTLVAHGLIKVCGDYFGNDLSIKRDDPVGVDPGTEARLTLSIQA